MTRKSIWILLAMLALISPQGAFAAGPPAGKTGDQGGADWTVENGDTIDGFYYNIRNFIIPAGVVKNLNSGLKTVASGGVGIFIQADTITINGTLDASSTGMSGGDGGTCMTGGKPGNVDPSYASNYFTGALNTYYTQTGRGLFGLPGSLGAYSGNRSHVCEPGYLIDRICFIWCWEVHACSFFGIQINTCNWGILDFLRWTKCRTDGYLCGYGGVGGGSGSGYSTPGCYGAFGDPGATNSDDPTKGCQRGSGGGPGGTGKSLPNLLNPSDRPDLTASLATLQNTLLTEVFFGTGGAGGGGGGRGGGGPNAFLNCSQGGQGGTGGGRIILEAFSSFNVGANGSILVNGGPGIIGGQGGGRPNDYSSCDCNTRTYYYQGGRGGYGGGGSGGGLLVSAPYITISSGAGSIQANGGPGYRGADDYAQDYDAITKLPAAKGGGSGGAGAIKLFYLPGSDGALTGGVAATKAKLSQKGCDYQNTVTTPPTPYTDVRDDVLKKVNFRVVTSSGALIPDYIETKVAGRTGPSNNYTLPMLVGHPYPIEVPLYKAINGKYYTFHHISPMQPSNSTNAPNKILDYKFKNETAVVQFVYQIVGYYKWFGGDDTSFTNCMNWLVYDSDGNYATPNVTNCVGFPVDNAPFVVDATYEPETLKKTEVVWGFHDCPPCVTTGTPPNEVKTCAQCPNTRDYLGNHSLVINGSVSFPGKTNKLIIRQNAGIQNIAYYTTWQDNFTSTAKPGITWTANSSLTMSGFQIEGTLQAASSGSSITSNGPFVVTSTGVANLTNNALNLRADLELQSNSTFISTTYPVTFNGSANANMRVYSKTFEISSLVVALTSDSASLLLQSDVGPAGSADLDAATTYKRLSGVSVSGGILDLNGFGLTITKQLQVSSTGRVLLSFNDVNNLPSKLNVLGIGLAAGASPLRLLNSAASTVSLDSDRGQIMVGTGSLTANPPDPFSSKYYEVAAGGTVFATSGGFYYVRTSGGSFRVDNGTVNSGWDFAVNSIGTVSFDRTQLSLDRSLTVNNPTLFNLSGSPVYVGTTTEAGNVTFINDGTSHPIKLGMDAIISLSGNYNEQAKSLEATGSGATVQMSGDNTTFKSLGNTYNRLIVSGAPVTYDTTLAGYGQAVFKGGINVTPISGRMPILKIVPGSTVRLGSGATLSIKGTLDIVGTAALPIKFTNTNDSIADNSYYSINILGEEGSFTGLLKARYVNFYFLGKDGLTIDESAALDTNYYYLLKGGLDPLKDNNLSDCSFLYPDPTSGTTVLTFRNTQPLVINHARFISQVKTANADGEMASSLGVVNVRKTKGDDGAGHPSYVAFTNEICQAGDTLCILADQTSYDFSGEMFEDDQYSRVMWTVRPPLVKSATVTDYPLNSEWSKVNVNIYPNFNPTTTKYCVWLVKDGVAGATNGYLETSANGQFDAKGGACDVNQNNFTYAQLNGENGFDVNVDPLYKYRVYVKAPAQNFQFYYPNGGSMTPFVFNQDEAIGMCGPIGSQVQCYLTTDKIVPDRFPPAVPSSAVLTTSTSTANLPTGEAYHYLNLSWGQVSDIPATDSTGVAANVDYIVLRGQGDNVGQKDVPYGVPAGSYTPINGEYDPFDVAAKWTFSAPASGGTTCNDPGVSCYVVANGLLTMSGGGGPYVPPVVEDGDLDVDLDDETEADADTTVVVEVGGESAILKPSADRNWDNGYMMQVDVRRENGSARGVDLLFLFRGAGAVDRQARWSVGEISGGGINSLLYTSDVGSGTIDPVVAQSKPIDTLFSVGSFHQLMVYVKGKSARGFLDGREMWTISLDSITGDTTYSFGTPVIGLMVKKQTAVTFDNFLFMPFLPKDGSGMPKAVADTYARDRSAPRTPVFTTDQGLSAASGSFTTITLNLPIPGTNGDLDNLTSGTGKSDRATAYWYTVMAVDSAGNTSNLVQNRGFENTNGWDAASTSYTNESTIVFEGYYSGLFTETKAPSQTLSAFGTGVLPAGSALRYANFVRLDSSALSGSGQFYPTQVKISHANGNSFTAMGMPINGATQGWQPNTVFVYDPANSFSTISSVLLKPSFGGLPTFTMYLDQARLDVLRGEKMAEGFKHMEVQYRTGGDPCATVGVWKALTTTDSSTYSDTSFTEGNSYRAYRLRACDLLGNCGDWQGGVPCVVDADCKDKSHTIVPFTNCAALGEGGLNSYCVRSEEGGSCVPGADVYTNAQVPTNPSIAFRYYNVGTRQYVEEFNLQFNWDSLNRAATEYMVALFNASTAEQCGSSYNAVGYLRKDGTLAVDPEDSAESGSGFWLDKSYERVAKNLVPNMFYCFRVMARNGDQKATGAIKGGATNWAGWSAVSPAKLPPSIPKVVTDTFKLKYGTNSGDSKRAIAIDGQMMQELTFNIRDLNNIGTPGMAGRHINVKSIGIRIAPHANWDPRSASSAFERGYFIATLNPDGLTWNVGLNPSASWSFSNKFVQLGPCSVEAVANTTTDFVVTLRWALKDADDGKPYDSLQDQGVAIAIVDEDGISSPWEDNMHSSCGEVFHTSYPPDKPVLVGPLDQIWTKNTSINFTAWSLIDKDRERLMSSADNFASDLFTRGCSQLDTTGDACATWGLAKPHNCIDVDQAGVTNVGDHVYYALEVCKNIDANGLCPQAADRFLKQDVAEVTSTSQRPIQINGQWYNKDIYTYNITAAIATEGIYFWHLWLRDHHTYEALGAGKKAAPAYYDVPPTKTNTYQIGVDFTKPVFPTGALVVSTITPEGVAVPNTVGGVWQRAARPTFTFSAAIQDPNNLGAGKTAPIRAYYTLLTNMTGVSASPTPDSIAPYRPDLSGVYHLVNGGREILNDPNKATYDDAYTDVASAPKPGDYWWCVQSVDMAENVSLPLCFNLKIDRPTVMVPLITSPTHPDWTKVYTGNDHPAGVNVYAPEFDLVDPLQDNATLFASAIDPTDPTGTRKRFPECETSDPVVCPLSFSKIVSYDFTLTHDDNVDPQSPPEDTNAPGAITSCAPADLESGKCVPICDANNRCYDSTEQSRVPTDTSKRFSFKFVSASEANNIFHAIVYQMYFGSAQQTGTYYFRIQGHLESGTDTTVGEFKINVGNCEKDCGSTTRSMRNGMTAMSFYVGTNGTADGATNGDAGRVLPFYLDRTEVSNAAYADCVKDGGCSALPSAALRSQTRANYFDNPDYANYPVVNITWDQAQAYCQWLDKRLPSEKEWRFAASRLSMDANTAIEGRRKLRPRDTVAVNEVSNSKSLTTTTAPQHLLDNVSEWLSDWWIPEEALALVEVAPEDVTPAMCESYLIDKGQLDKAAQSELRAACSRKLARGGSFLSSEPLSAERLQFVPSQAQTNVGFRCAKDVSGSTLQVLNKTAALNGGTNELSMLRQNP